MERQWIALLLQALSAMRPEMRKGLKAAMADLKEQAKQSNNPWDDVGVFMLEALLGL